MLRYVILEHDHPFLHWDLMLEANGVLRTWRLLVQPAAGIVLRAESSFDHRLVYLDYEGPVSGDRGHVVRWDEGVYTWQQEDKDRFAVHLNGKRLQGLLQLERSNEGWQGSFVAGQGR
jgi:hypothetical protein